MRIPNMVFKDREFWSENKCASPDDILDMSRCLEDSAYPVMRFWHMTDGKDDSPKPSESEALSYPEYDMVRADKDAPAEGWIAAEMKKPYISRFFAEKVLGEYVFTYSHPDYDPDLYCDDELLAGYIYLGGHFPTGKKASGKTPVIYMHIPTPNKGHIAGFTCRSYFRGLKENNELIRDVARSLRASCELLSTVNRRDNNYLHEQLTNNKSKLSDEERKELTASLLAAANAVDMKALYNGDGATFFSSLELSLKKLAPMAAYAKRFTIYLIGHSHIDLAWKWRYPETLECMKGTIEDQMKLMERDSKYVYVESSAIVWRDLKKMYPDFWKKVRYFADRGQFEPQGGMMCEPDGMLPGQESLMRQVEEGQKTAFDTCGKISTCGMNIDGFGFNAGLPKVYTHFGINNFVTQKLRYNEYTVFPHILFQWEADDGSKMLCLHAYPGHSNYMDSDEIAGTVRIHHLTDGYYKIPIMWGYGNHGGGPQQIHMDRVALIRSLTVSPNIEYSGFTRYFDDIRKEDLSTVPVIKGELFLETHHKTYTVQNDMKAQNRLYEKLLLNSESLQAATGIREDLESAWDTELFNQFHDVLSGTSLTSVYRDVDESYQKASETIKKANYDCVKKCFGEGGTNYIFNPLAWEHDVPAALPAEGFDNAGVLEDSRGNKVNYQKTADGSEIVFTAKKLPALGFERYKKASAKLHSKLKASGNTITNGKISVSFDSDKGVISSLKDAAGREYSRGGIGELKVLEDTIVRDYQTWNMGLTGVEWDVKCVSFEKTEEGPARIVYRAKYTFGRWEDKKPYFNICLWHTPGVKYPTSFFEQDFILCENEPFVRVVLHTDWWEDYKVLKVAAHTDIDNSHARYATAFGEIERPTKRETPYEKARYEVPSNNFGELYNNEKALTILTKTKHGYDALGNRIRLTILTSPLSADKNLVPDPIADRGRHIIEYAFYPHGKANDDVIRLAAEYERGTETVIGSEKPKAAIGKDLVAPDEINKVTTSVRLTEKGVERRSYNLRTRSIED